MRKKIVLAATLLFWLSPADAETIETGQSICYEAQNNINILVDYTATTCIPALGRQQALSFILVSSQPVFSVEASKKGWLLGVVGLLGKILNDKPTVNVDQSDANLMKNRVTFGISATLTKSLQHRVYNGQIELETMYAEIQQNMTRTTILDRH